MTYTYIRISVRSKYVEFNEPLDSAVYNNIGSTWEDYTNDLWVPLSAEQVAFHVANPNASVYEVWNMQITPVPERTLEQAKAEMISTIDSYDSSDNVNVFTVNNSIEGWFTPTERSNYRNSIDAAKLLNIPEVSFYVGNMEVTVTTGLAEQMLAQVQLYADQCFMVTKQHKLDVEALTTIAEVDAFDYTADYPAHLNFNIE